jgi:hypothetical protein
MAVTPVTYRVVPYKEVWAVEKLIDGKSASRTACETYNEAREMADVLTAKQASGATN